MCYLQRSPHLGRAVCSLGCLPGTMLPGKIKYIQGILNLSLQTAPGDAEWVKLRQVVPGIASLQSDREGSSRRAQLSVKERLKWTASPRRCAGSHRLPRARTQEPLSGASFKAGLGAEEASSLPDAATAPWLSGALASQVRVTPASEHPSALAGGISRHQGSTVLHILLVRATWKASQSA